MLVELLRSTFTQDGIAIDNVLEEICRLNKGIHELFKADSEEIDETEGAGPEEMPRFLMSWRNLPLRRRLPRPSRIWRPPSLPTGLSRPS